MAAVRATEGTRPGTRGIDLAVAAGVLVLCLALYATTLAPGLGFPGMDSHELAVNAFRLGVAHPSGYPLYTWVGFVFSRLVPLGDPAYRMNLLSAVTAALGMGLLVLVGRRLGLGLGAAGFAALMLGLSTELWSQAVITEVYAPDVAMVALTLLLLLRWADRVRAGDDGATAFATFAAVLGLSLGTHLSNLLFAPAYALFVLATDPGILRRPREIAVAFVVFLAGAAQYFWLPLRGGRFDQFPSPAPTTLADIHTYTFGAFAPQRFAFPLGMFPIRIGEYVTAMRDNLGVVGIGLGVLGTWGLLFTHAARFWLLAGMYLANVIVFSQFSVQDVRVFYIAGYVPWVLFAGFGLQAVLDATRMRWAVAAGGLGRVVRGGVLGALAVWLAAMGLVNHVANDETGNTLVGDFGPNAFDMLPQGAFVTVARGAFGADMVYWQAATRLRRDVTILGQPPVSPPGRNPGAPLFTTVRIADGRPTPQGKRGLSPAEVPPDAWYVPVLFGNTYALRLARVDDAPPPIIVPAPPPSGKGERQMGGLTLLDARVTVRPEAPTPRARVETWWRLPEVGRFVVATRVDGRTLESHEVGLELLMRYAAEVGAPPRPVVHEDFDVVLPSTLAAGPHAMEVGVVDFGEASFRTHWVGVGDVVVE